MHTHETLARINVEWPNPMSPKERRETAIRNLKGRLGVTVDRTDPMLPAVIAMEMALLSVGKRRRWRTTTGPGRC